MLRFDNAVAFSHIVRPSRRVKPNCIENCSAFVKQGLPECCLYRQKNAPICSYLLLFATSFCYCRLLSCDETSPAAATVGVGLQCIGSETLGNPTHILAGRFPCWWPEWLQDL